MDIAGAYMFAFFGGFVPGALWLFFWLMEDKRHPEPKRLLALAFCVGVLAVPLALVVQRAFAGYFIHPLSLAAFMKTFPLAGALSLFVFAAIEELVKFIAAYAAALWSKEVDEPIDYIIYLIAAALGFSAYETALFILSGITPLVDGAFTQGIIMSNMRAIGAMLLHVVSSSVIGLALAFAFYRSSKTRFWYGILGFILATVLHGLFNLAIIRVSGGNALFAFVAVWIAIIVLLGMFERAKKIHPHFSH